MPKVQRAQSYRSIESALRPMRWNGQDKGTALREMNTTKEVSEITGLSTTHLRRLANDGKIEAEKVDGQWMFPKDSLKRRSKRPRKDMPAILEDGPSLWKLYQEHGSLVRASKAINVSTDTLRKRLKAHGYELKHGVGWKEQSQYVTSHEAPQYDLKRYFSTVAFAQKHYGDDVACLLTPCPVNCPRWLAGGENGVDCLMSDEPCIYENGNSQELGI